MKHLLLFMILIINNHNVFSADSGKKIPVLLTPSKALDKWWNEDTGKVSANFITSEHQKQEARENLFHCDVSSCERRDVRRAMTMVAAASAVGAFSMPHLAIPILSFGAISTAALGAQLVMHQSPDDPRKIKLE